MENSPEMQYTNIQCQNSLVLDPVMQSVYVSHSRYAESIMTSGWLTLPSLSFVESVFEVIHQWDSWMQNERLA